MSGNPQTSNLAEKEFYQMYYEHQYDRMKELENQRLIMTNVIVGMSVIAFSLAFEDITKLNLINGVGLPVIVVIANLIALMFNKRSRAYIKMHQKRAHKVLEIIAPEIENLDKSIPKPFNSDKDFFGRPRLQSYLHLLLILSSLLPIIFYYLQP